MASRRLTFRYDELHRCYGCGCWIRLRDQICAISCMDEANDRHWRIVRGDEKVTDLTEQLALAQTLLTQYQKEVDSITVIPETPPPSPRDTGGGGGGGGSSSNPSSFELRHHQIQVVEMLEQELHEAKHEVEEVRQKETQLIDQDVYACTVSPYVPQYGPVNHRCCVVQTGLFDFIVEKESGKILSYPAELPLKEPEESLEKMKMYTHVDLDLS